MKKIKQLAAIAILGILTLTSCGGAKSKGISQANPQAIKPTVAAPALVAKISLNGKVIDYTNKAPVPGAKLITFDKHEVTASDKGEFTLQVPQDKGFTFRVKAQGYQETLAGGRIKAATSGVEVKLAKLNSGIFPVTLNIEDKGAKLFKGPIVPKEIDITQGKLYQVAFPKEKITKFIGLTKPIALSYFAPGANLQPPTWQYVMINADGTIKSGNKWLKPANGYFLFGTINATLDCEGDSTSSDYCYTASLYRGSMSSNQQWSLIGCPYEEPIPLSYCIIRHGNIYSCNLDEAYNNNLTGPVVFYHYNGNNESWEETYSPNGVLEPNKGYYYLTLENCLLDIINVPPTPEADNVIKQLAAALKQNNIEAALSFFIVEKQTEIREYFFGLTTEQRFKLGEIIEQAVLESDYEGWDRTYYYIYSPQGIDPFNPSKVPHYLNKIEMYKNTNGIWKITVF